MPLQIPLISTRNCLTAVPLESYIPLNPRSNLSSECECPINENGIPCCPKDPSLEMKPEGKLITKSGIKKYKFVYPKMVWDYKPQTQRTHRKCTCESPCTASKCGRMFYIYPEQNPRAYPGTLRGTEKWDNTYKIRTTVERSINHFKYSFCLAERKHKIKKHSMLIYKKSKTSYYCIGLTNLTA